MTAKIFVTIFAVFCLTNCDKVTKTNQELVDKNPQITESDIYSILEYIIKEEKLNKDYGLKIEPAKCCDSGRRENIFNRINFTG